MARTNAKFLRIGYTQYSKLGLRRKAKQVYRKGKGGENKMRLKMKGHLRNVSIGFRTEKKNRDLVNGLKKVIVNNVDDLKKLKKGEIAIVAKLGNKKRIEIAEYALKNNIRLFNINSKKFIAKVEEIRKKQKEERMTRDEKKKDRDKKAKEAEKKKTEVEKKDKENSTEKENKETKLEETIKQNESDKKTEVEEKK
jgi:ribosomal protein L32E